MAHIPPASLMDEDLGAVFSSRSRRKALVVPRCWNPVPLAVLLLLLGAVVFVLVVATGRRVAAVVPAVAAAAAAAAASSSAFNFKT